MRRKEHRGGGGGGETGVKAEDHVGVGGIAFQLDAGKKRCAVTSGDELQVASASRLEGLFHRRAGAPIRGEAVVRQDLKDGGFCQRRRCDRKKARNKEVSLHRFLHGATEWSGMEDPCTFPPPV
jgi:hypothetical protein